MKFRTLLAPFVFASGCAIATDRSGYSAAWYYERLTPYYEATAPLTPRVRVRAVREIVGIPVTFSDGTPGHADVYRPDIELFFAKPVTRDDDRDTLIKAAIESACPFTDLNQILARVAYSDQAYVVLHNVPCRLRPVRN